MFVWVVEERESVDKDLGVFVVSGKPDGKYSCFHRSICIEANSITRSMARAESESDLNTSTSTSTVDMI